MREAGRVKWFNEIKGFGVIRREQGGDLRVHYRKIRGVGYRSLNEGDRVEFQVSRGHQGLQAEDVVVLVGGWEGGRSRVS